MKRTTIRFVLSTIIYFLALTLQSQECSDLFFSEYIEGTGNNKGMEIYNPTNNVIDLSKYYIARFSNGATTYESGGLTQLSGFLLPHSTFLLVNGQKTSTETSPACDPDLQLLAQLLDHDYPAPTFMNGNDAIALYKDKVGSGNKSDFIAIDLFGIIGGGMSSTDEGWAAFTDEWIYRNIYENNAVVGIDSTIVTNYIIPEGYYWIPWTENHTLVRKPTVKNGITTNPSPAFVVTTEWDTLPGGANNWDSLGSHTCDCFESTSRIVQYQKTNFTLAPNPISEGYLQIIAEEPVLGVTIFNIQGKIIATPTLNSAERIIRLNLENIKSGLYIIKLKTVNGEFSKKIIIE